MGSCPTQHFLQAPNSLSFLATLPKRVCTLFRLQMPAGYKVPAHNHPQYESVTVLSGEFHVGMGGKLDSEKGVALLRGGFVEAPAKMNHYAWTTSDTIVQVAGPGPFGITYVNPADDPSKK